jgi:Ni/Fe-hydrogenase subunit HybB-like protein
MLDRSTSWCREKLLLGRSWREYARALDTRGNRIFGVLVAVGLTLIAYRFSAGLGAVTHLSQDVPWGLWIGFDMLCGVALAAGGYTLASAVYILGLERYRPVVRPAILTGFLGYLFAVLGLLCDLGQPWRIPYPIFYKHGVTSVMFEVGWCVFLYLTVLGLEFTPAVFEWLGWPRLRQRVRDLALGLTAFGVVLSTLHQSSLGSLFLSAPGKVHPLWYSPFLPVFFFVSSLVAGLSMVIVESALSHRAFPDRAGHAPAGERDELTLGLGRAAALLLFSYFFLRLQGLAASGRWGELSTGYGAWYLVEILGLVLVPCLIFARATRRRDVAGVRAAAVLAVLGVVVQRLDVSVVAFQWNVAHRYVPSLAEVIVSLTLVTLGVWTFRWIVNRMPVLGEHALAASE